MTDESWPPPPDGQLKPESFSYRAGGVAVRLVGDALEVRFVWIRGLFRLTRDCTVVSGGSRPTTWAGVRYVKLDRRRGFGQLGGGGILVGLDESQPRPSKWWRERLGNPKANANEVTLSYAYRYQSAEQVAEIMAEFMNVPLVVEPAQRR